MRLIVLLVALLWAVPVWAGVPNAAGWYNLGVNLHTVCQLGSNWPTGCKIVEAWGGGAYDSRRGLLFFTGGGHSDGQGNEMVALSVGTPNVVTGAQIVTRLKNSTAFVDGTGCTQGTSWRTFHTYSNIEYYKGVDASGNDSAAEDRYVFNLTGIGLSGNMTSCVIVHNPTTGTFTQTTLHSELTANRNSGFYGGAWTLDERQHVLVVVGQQSIFYFNPRTSTWTKPAQTEYNDDFADTADMFGAIDPVRRRYYVIGRGKIWWWNISGTGTIARNQVTVSGVCSTAVASMPQGPPAAVYYPARDKIVIWRGGSTIYLLDTATHTCTSTTVGTGPSLNSNGAHYGVWGRFRFDARNNLFMTCNNTVNSGSAANDQCWALRLDAQSADTDFLRRANAPGVWKYQGFDAECVPGLTDGQHYFAGSAGTAGRACDTAIKTSGTSSFRLTIPAGNSSATPSGEWREGMRPGVSVHTGGTGFGQNTTVYWSYRIRITQSMKTNIEQFWRAGSAKTGWKHANVHNMPQGSCGPLEFTGTISTDVSPATQIFYTECGNRGVYTTTSGAQGLPYIQQGETFPLTSATNGWSCDFNNAVNGAGTGQGCFNWQFFDEWLTFKVRLQIGTFGSANSSVRIWVARDGGTQWLSLANSPNYTFNANAPANQREFNVMSFTNFMTGNNQSAPTVAHMWYDEFIVSSLDIDLPATVGGGGDTTPPSAPTGITIQ